MFQQEKEYLEDAYSYYQKTGERSMQYNFSGTNREKQLTIRCLDALRDDGYIRQLAFTGSDSLLRVFVLQKMVIKMIFFLLFLEVIIFSLLVPEIQYPITTTKSLQM